MKTTLILVALLVSACATTITDESGRTDLPFKEYVAPDGSRTWSAYFADALMRYHDDQSYETLIARQVAWSRFCENGYTIDRVETVEDGRVYHGSCL